MVRNGPDYSLAFISSLKRPINDYDYDYDYDYDSARLRATPRRRPRGIDHEDAKQPMGDCDKERSITSTACG